MITTRDNRLRLSNIVSDDDSISKSLRYWWRATPYRRAFPMWEHIRGNHAVPTTTMDGSDITGGNQTIGMFGAVKMDASNDFMSAPCPGKFLDNNTEGTVSFRMRTSSTVTISRVIGLKDSGLGQLFLVNMSRSTGGDVELFMRGGTSDQQIWFQTLTGGHNDNQWHTVTMTYNSKILNDAQAYIDGVPQSLQINTFTTNFSTTAFSNNVFLGALNNNSTTVKNWGGEIDDIRLFNRRLKRAEIRSIHFEPNRMLNHWHGIPYVAPTAAATPRLTLMGVG